MEGVNQDLLHSLPEKSHEKYKNVYLAFRRWQEQNEDTTFCEQVLLDYFNEASEKYKSSSLWSIFSMLKSTIICHHNIDISKYSRLLAFLKKTSVGFESKKVKAFSAEQINKFLVKAPDERYLAMKTILVFGVAGGCGSNEITNVKTNDVKIYGTDVIVSLPRTNTKFPKIFPISGEFAKIVQRYMQLRPANVATDRFFLQYGRGSCSVIGKNKVAGVPKEIAKFLKLDPSSYTVFSFRLSSATILASNGDGIKTERHGKLKSTKVAKEDKQESFAHNVFSEITNFNEQQTQIKAEPIEPMLPFTTAIMKSKPTLYMGLTQNRFLRLLQLVNERTQLSEVKVMLTLRKLCLNEKFEVLGDLFDLDETTTEHYFYDSKRIIIDLVNILATTTPISNHFDVITEPIIKIEECVSLNAPDPIAVELITTPYNYDATTEMNTFDHVDIKPSWHELSDFNIPSEEDPDFPPEDIFSATLDKADDHDNGKRKKSVKCTLCKRFYASRLLKSHTEDMHLGLRNLNRTICGLCFKKFDTKALLKAHYKDTHEGCSYGCDVCGKIFSSKVYVSTHILTKHSLLKTYLCDSCGEGFPIQSSLTEHVKRKHNGYKHKCSLCDMRFICPRKLQDHFFALHTDERPFKCEFKGCGKTFKWPSSFKSHKRVHALDKFECSICLKQFSFKGNLQNHIRNIHNQIINSK